ncbi:MAG: SMI1/KNR4 family protein [Cyanobacteria bacterium SZAS LIN-2]|nr:SMI1/KNR4 family protein [Cyanobacteria bacterium SZAS LIN-2]
MAEILHCGPQISDEDLKRVEQTLGLVLPSQYHALMLASNGGIVSPGSFQCVDGEDGNIAWLYHVLPGDDDDILERAAERAGRLPKDFVAVGCDGGGNEICIDCGSGEGYGKVYFWDHEKEADETQGLTPESAGNVHLIADSFDQFISRLCE